MQKVNHTSNLKLSQVSPQLSTHLFLQTLFSISFLPSNCLYTYKENDKDSVEYSIKYIIIIMSYVLQTALHPSQRLTVVNGTLKGTLAARPIRGNPPW